MSLLEAVSAELVFVECLLSSFLSLFLILTLVFFISCILSFIIPFIEVMLHYN